MWTKPVPRMYSWRNSVLLLNPSLSLYRDPTPKINCAAIRQMMDFFIRPFRLFIDDSVLLSNTNITLNIPPRTNPILFHTSDHLDSNVFLKWLGYASASIHYINVSMSSLGLMFIGRQVERRGAHGQFGDIGVLDVSNLQSGTVGYVEESLIESSLQASQGDQNGRENQHQIGFNSENEFENALPEVRFKYREKREYRLVRARRFFVFLLSLILFGIASLHPKSYGANWSWRWGPEFGFSNWKWRAFFGGSLVLIALSIVLCALSEFPLLGTGGCDGSCAPRKARNKTSSRKGLIRFRDSARRIPDRQIFS